MRKVVMYCDRCKNEFKKWDHKKPELYGIAEFVYEDRNPYLDGAKDLCESCYTELEKWWDSAPKAESKKVKVIGACETCKYVMRAEDEEPCKACSNNFVNKWRAKDADVTDMNVGKIEEEEE